jgi:hypothetical protein
MTETGGLAIFQCPFVNSAIIQVLFGPWLAVLSQRYGVAGSYRKFVAGLDMYVRPARVKLVAFAKAAGRLLHSSHRFGGNSMSKIGIYLVRFPVLLVYFFNKHKYVILRKRSADLLRLCESYRVIGCGPDINRSNCMRFATIGIAICRGNDYVMSDCQSSAVR